MAKKELNEILDQPDLDLVCSVSTFNEIAESSANIFALIRQRKINNAQAREHQKLLEKHCTMVRNISMDKINASLEEFNSLLKQAIETNTKNSALDNFKKIKSSSRYLSPDYPYNNSYKKQEKKPQ